MAAKRSKVFLDKACESKASALKLAPGYVNNFLYIDSFLYVVVHLSQSERG